MPYRDSIRRIKEEMDFRNEIDRLADYCDLIAVSCIAADREGLGLGDSLPSLAMEMRERLRAVGHAYEKHGERWARKRRKAAKRRAAERAALPLAEGDTLRVLEGPHAGTEAVVTKAYDSGGEIRLQLQQGDADGAQIRAEVTPAAEGTSRSRADAARSAAAREAVAPLAAVLAGPPPPTVPAGPVPTDEPEGP